MRLRELWPPAGAANAGYDHAWAASVLADLVEEEAAPRNENDRPTDRPPGGVAPIEDEIEIDVDDG